MSAVFLLVMCFRTNKKKENNSKQSFSNYNKTSFYISIIMLMIIKVSDITMYNIESRYNKLQGSFNLPHVRLCVCI